MAKRGHNLWQSRADPDTIQIPEAVSLLEKHRPRDKAEAYASGLFKLAKWVKMTVKPERMASFDYSKDKAYQSAVKE